METKNLMEINSKNIGTMDSLLEYQKLQMNKRVGEYLEKASLNIARDEQLIINTNDLNKIWSKLESDFEVYQLHSTRVVVLADDFMAELWISFISRFMGLSMNISASSIEKCLQGIELVKQSLSKFLVDQKVIEYYVHHYDNGNLSTTYYCDVIDIDFNPLAVPFINNCDEYIKKFIESDSNILILQGGAGTGKSIFTKYILSKMQEYTYNIKKEPKFKVHYSFDENIFYAPAFFDKLIYDDYDVIVLEDFNQTIHKNSDEQGGLNPLHKLLSLTDGVISKKSKIIITSNIEGKTQLLPSLIRPGRCFDVVNFRNLEGVEIDDLCDSCAKDLNLQIESINLSEFYAKCNGEQNNFTVNNRVGF